jgi:hypothetical protein
MESFGHGKGRRGYHCGQDRLCALLLSATRTPSITRVTAQPGIVVGADTGVRRLGRPLILGVALLALYAVLLNGAGRFRQPIVVDIGPSTGRYGSGFEDSEETPPTTSRWTRQTANLDLPLIVDAAPVRFSVRAARYLDEATRITLTSNGRAFASFEQPRGRQRIQQVDAPIPEGPLNLGLVADDPKLGLALDWIRLEGARWRIPWGEWTVWIVPVGVLGALLLNGASLSIAGGATVLILLCLSLAAAVDPFGFVHAMRDVAVPAVAIGLLMARILRGHTTAVLAVLVAVLLKGGFQFHPAFFYNDVRQNDRFVGAIKSYPGGLLERATQAQIDLGVGYPRIIGGKKYAFPYSPLFYWPFTQLPADRDVVVRAMKHAAIAGAALEVALAFLVARRLAPSLAGTAAWLTLAFPIVTSRLMFAMWPTVVAHALDLLMILWAVRVVEKPQDHWAWFGFLAALSASLLTYVSSLFTVSAFALALALVASGIRWPLLCAWTMAMFAVVAGLYGRFALTFLTEILPNLLFGTAHLATTAPSEDTGNLPAAFFRIFLFGGYGFPCLAVAGLALLARRQDAPAKVLKAYAAAFLGLVLLRGLSGGLFKDLKEVEFGGPALAVLSSFAIGHIDSAVARHFLVAGLICGGLWMQYGYFETWSRLVLR